MKLIEDLDALCFYRVDDDDGDGGGIARKMPSTFVSPFDVTIGYKRGAGSLERARLVYL